MGIWRLISKCNATKPDDEKYLALSDAVITKFFGTESDKDWRLKYQLGPNTSSFYRSLKYKKQDEGSGFGKVNSTMVPMIRMSEVYYIAAEAIMIQIRNWPRHI